MSYVRPSGPGALRAGYPPCIIDTDSHLSVIPKYIWRHFKPGAVTPLPFDTTMPLHRRFVSIGGGNYPYDPGELTVRLFDQERRTLNLRVAQLTRDNGTLTIPVTLGLRVGALDGHVLRAEPDPAASFGQSWFLEDP